MMIHGITAMYLLKFIYTLINFYKIFLLYTIFHFNLVLPMLLVPTYEIYKTIKII